MLNQMETHITGIDKEDVTQQIIILYAVYVKVSEELLQAIITMT